MTFTAAATSLDSATVLHCAIRIAIDAHDMLSQGLFAPLDRTVPGHFAKDAIDSFLELTETEGQPAPFPLAALDTSMQPEGLKRGVGGFVVDWPTLFRTAGSLRFIGDDWDGFGAPAPNQGATTLAREALAHLGERNLPPSTISATVEGGIGMVFRSGERFASLEILNDGELLVLLERDSHPNSSTIFSASGADLVSVLDRLGNFIERRECGPTPPAG
ncbi:MAG: hypothetical protein WD066_09720 [Planctomycetaceae bacterium]